MVVRGVPEPVTTARHPGTLPAESAAPSGALGEAKGVRLSHPLGTPHRCPELDSPHPGEDRGPRVVLAAHDAQRPAPAKRPSVAPRPDTNADALGVQLHRRAAAARRLDGADPWATTGQHPDVLDARQLDAWAATAHHLATLGLRPVLPEAVAHALRLRHGADRALMERIDPNGDRAA